MAGAVRSSGHQSFDDLATEWTQRREIDVVGPAPEAIPFEAFRTTVSETFVPLLAETNAESAFRGNLSHAEFGALRLARVAAGSHVVRRSERMIRRSDPDYYKLTVQLAGEAWLSQAGRNAKLVPGDLALYDTTKPYELRFGGTFRMIVLMFPRSLLSVPERSVGHIIGRRIPGDHNLPRLIKPLVTGLLQHADQHVTQANGLLCDALVGLLGATLADELALDTRPAAGPRQAARLDQIKGYIEDRLADPRLEPGDIALAHHISPRYLRKLFESEGESVSRWIRMRRLEHCRRDLARPDLYDKSVTEVANRWGFTDAAHFSRVFRRMYGQSPREYRQCGSVTSASTLQNIA